MEQSNRWANISPPTDSVCHVGPNLIDESITFDFSGSRVNIFILFLAEVEWLQTAFPNGLYSYDLIKSAVNRKSCLYTLRPPITLLLVIRRLLSFPIVPHFNIVIEQNYLLAACKQSSKFL